MKTDELIALLAGGPVAVSAHGPERRVAAAEVVALPFVIAAMLVALGVRPDLAAAATLPMFWLKLAVPLALAAAAYVATTRLARPGGTAAGAWTGVALTVGSLWLMAAASLLAAAPGERGALVAGRTALPCVASIVALSLPLFAATLWALRSLAPTRPRLAGAAAGLLSAALAAAVYALHCDETAIGFIAVWYVLGMAIPAVLGALVGPRVLRWT